MSKILVSRKALKQGYTQIIGVGYCEAQYLLRYQKPMFYSVGVYGWACDGYDIGGVLISTGYQYIHGLKVKSDQLREYERKAQELAHNNDLPEETKIYHIQKMLIKFIAQTINNK